MAKNKGKRKRSAPKASKSVAANTREDAAASNKVAKKAVEASSNGKKGTKRSETSDAKRRAPAVEPAGQSKGPSSWRLLAYLLPPLLFAGIYLGLANGLRWERDVDVEPIHGTQAASKVSEDSLKEVPALVASAVVGRKGFVAKSARLAETNQAVFVALRKDGLTLAHGWKRGGTVGAKLAELIGALVARTPKAKEADTAEICIAHSFRPVDGNRRSAFSNIYRGVRGIEIETAKDSFRLSPTYMIATNRDFKKALGILAGQAKVDVASIADDNIQTFECDQILVDIAAGRAVSMYRGNQLVSLAEVTRKNTVAFAARMGNWLIHHVQVDGRMTYKWWPSVGRESDANNMIRQWMATAALALVGHDRKDQSVFDLTAKNIDYNLSRFYKVDGKGNGFILYNNKAKLGAMALAAYSILIHPERERWASTEAAILKTIYELQQDTGRYTTFYVPPGRSDNENFYPGETQLYLATRYERERDSAMLERIMRTFRFYRTWHRENRNPAFIPWHTQAYYTTWAITKDRELADFVFEMNDWLVAEMQQWDGAKTPDAKGRFYNPRQRFGPPHASSTGVYLEGLIDAYKLAREIGDETRRRKYARSMIRGIRSSMQLQFVDDVDLFYTSKKEASRGGLRTTVYNNEIRVDNVQHTLMGILKIVREISDEDWAHGLAKN